MFLLIALSLPPSLSINTISLPLCYVLSARRLIGGSIGSSQSSRLEACLMISGDGFKEPSRHRHCKLPLSNAKEIKQTALGERGAKTGRHSHSGGWWEKKTCRKIEELSNKTGHNQYHKPWCRPTCNFKKSLYLHYLEDKYINIIKLVIRIVVCKGAFIHQVWANEWMYEFHMWKIP